MRNFYALLFALASFAVGQGTYHGGSANGSQGWQAFPYTSIYGPTGSQYRVPYFSPANTLMTDSAFTKDTINNRLVVGTYDAKPSILSVLTANTNKYGQVDLAADTSSLSLLCYGTAIGAGNTLGVARAGGAFIRSIGKVFAVGTLDTSRMVLGTNNAARMTFLGAGNIGIGTAAPAYDLQIDKNSASGVEVSVRNGTSGATSYSALSARTATSVSAVGTYTAGFTSTGAYRASGTTFEGTGTGGASVLASNASGDLRFYSGGGTDAKLRMSFSSAGAITTPSTFASTSWLTARQIGQTVQTSGTSTGAIAWDLASGNKLQLTAALTGNITVTVSNPVAGSESVLFLQQGGIARTVTIAMTGVTFNVTNTTTTGAGSVAIPGVGTVNQYVAITLYWSSPTLCYLDAT